MKRVESKIVVGEAPTGTRNLANLTDSGSHSRIPSVDRSDGMFEGVLDRGQALKGRETKQAALQCIVAPLLQAWWLRISIGLWLGGAAAFQPAGGHGLQALAWPTWCRRRCSLLEAVEPWRYGDVLGGLPATGAHHAAPEALLGGVDSAPW